MPKFTSVFDVPAAVADGRLHVEVELPSSTVAHAASDRPLFVAVAIASARPADGLAPLKVEGRHLSADLGRPCGRLAPVELEAGGPLLPPVVLLAGKYTGAPAQPAVKVEWCGGAEARGSTLILGAPEAAPGRRPIDGAKNARNFVDVVAGELRAVVEETGVVLLVPRRQSIEVAPALAGAKRRLVRATFEAADLPLESTERLRLHVGYTPCPRAEGPAGEPSVLDEELASHLPADARRRFLEAAPASRGGVLREHLERLSSLLWAAQLAALTPDERALARAAALGQGDPRDDDRLVDVAIDRVRALGSLLVCARHVVAERRPEGTMRELEGAVRALDDFDVLAALGRAASDEPCVARPIDVDDVSRSG